MATANRFSTIHDVVDKSLEIIIDNDTGYYNITKIIKYIESNKVTDNFEVSIIVDTSNKRRKKIDNFMILKSTKELIKSIKTTYNLKTDDNDNLTYPLKKNIPEKYAGTYIHKTLFNHALSWIDTGYAIKISKILDDCRNEYNLKLKYDKERLETENKEKTCKIDMLLNDNKDLKKQIADLISHTKEANNKLDEAKIDREELFEKVNETNTKLSETNTKLDKTNNILKKVKHMVNVPNTKDDDVTQYYTLLYDKSINQIKMVIGQKKYNSKKINQNINCTVEEFTYNPSPTSLKHATRKMIKDLPEKYSNKLTEINKIHNEKIRKYKRIIIKTNRDNILSENEKNDKIDICNSKIEHYTNIVNDNKNKYDIIINGLPLMNNSNIILNEWSYDEIKKLIRDCIDNQNDYDDVVVNEEDE